MIEIDICLDSKRCLRFLEIRGHSGLEGEGSDILCAAVSNLAGSTGRVLFTRDGIGVEGGPDCPGEYAVHIRSVTPQNIEWLKGVTDLILRSLCDLNAGYPANMKLQIHDYQNIIEK